MRKVILISMGCIALLFTSSKMARDAFKSKYYLYNWSSSQDSAQIMSELSQMMTDSLQKRDINWLGPQHNSATILDLIDYANDLNSDILKINRKYNNIMASQMAVGNLFQPYSVKKLNLTAAVGQYRSSSSIAVGTGYRFNENVAARASASFVKGGSTGFGAGINLEY